MGRRKSSILRAGTKFYASYVITSPYEHNKSSQDTEGMIGGLSLQALLDYINSDNYNGLTSFLLNKHVQIDESDADGWSAVTYAVSQGKLEPVQILLQHGSDLHQRSSEATSLLHHAAIEGHVQVAAKLLELGAEVDPRDSGCWTPLLWACYTNCLEMASLLLQHNADPNAKGIYHCTGVVWAAGRGNLQLVRLLISHGARCDHGDKYGTTPLIWACRAGHADIVEELLDQGAQVDTVGMYSWTPLLMAVKGNHANIVSLLLKYSPNVNAIDQDGMTALAIACKEGNSDIVFQLLASGAYVNLQDKSGDTNLILAAKAGHKQIVDALIKRYADLDTKGKENKTCLYWAVEKNHASVVKTLLAAGADIEIQNIEGNTPLLRAVKNRNLEIVQMLIDKKAKLSAADKAGDTALHIAMRARSKAIVGALLKNPKHSQLLYKPNRAGETPYNIDVSNQKTILSLLFGSRKLNTNMDTENMLGYDLYGSVLADILTEPSLSMPITVGLYAKWGSGKSFLLSKLREEMVNFARDWVDPTFHFSPLLFFLILHISTMFGLIIWILNYFTSTKDFYGLISIPVLFVLFYTLLFSIRKGTYKVDWLPLYDLNVWLAKRFNELKLLVNVVFCHPPGSDYLSKKEQAQPLKLFFTEKSKVSTSAGVENSVVQVIGSLYDSLENTYGTFSTRLYRAFRPRPVKSSSAQRLRKLCCIPYAALYCFSYIILVLEIIIVIVKLEVNNGDMQFSITKEVQSDINQTLLVLAILLGIILGLIVISNIYTIGQVVNALLFSSRKHLQKTVAKHDLVQSEGYLQAVKNEVNLLQQMVKTLDSFSGQQSRLIVIVDGLDSVEQRKILSVLDTVHNLFSNPGNPFIIILAIDPHVIIKAIELNLNQVFVDTSIGGYAYLRNMVHLPFFLQNSGLRKVKVAQQLAAKRNPHTWMGETEESRKMSIESTDDVGVPRSIARLRKKKSSKLFETPDSRMGSRINSVESNLHKMSSGTNPMELNKMLLTDDYFSDVNPRSMRRLMNVIYVMGRLLKAFSIEFNWTHLSSWANITEQWPYRASWITLYVESCEDKLDDNLSLKHIYDKIKPAIPTKELEPLLCHDRDEKKLDAFLAYYRKTLTVANLKIFLPFTINLDPFLKKVIKDEVQNMEELGITIFSSPDKQLNMSNQSYASKLPLPSNSAPLTRRQAAGLSRKMAPNNSQEASMPGYPQLPPHLLPMTLPWLQQQLYQPQQQNMMFNQHQSHSNLSRHKSALNLPSEVEGLKLSSYSVDQICLLLKSQSHINDKMIDVYSNTIRENNISGRVLFYCQTEDLKEVLKMNFGDWELFKILICRLKEEEQTFTGSREDLTDDRKNHTNVAGVTIQDATPVQDDKSRSNSVSNRKRLSSQERQVVLEEATVTGLLSTLNEDAQEDVLNEEKDEDRHSEVDEADVLYYYNPTSSSQNIDLLDNAMPDAEKGSGSTKKHREPREILWSAMSSRQGSNAAELDKLGTISSPLSSVTSTASHLSSILEADAAGDNIRVRNHSRERGAWGEARAGAWGTRKKVHDLNNDNVPVIQFKRSLDRGGEKEGDLDEEDPYAWLSKTAPPSPGSTKKTKKKESKEEEVDTAEEDKRERMKRVSSRERMARVKRKIHKALEHTEPGNMPAVQRARPKLDEYEEINHSCEPSRSPSPVSGTTGLSPEGAAVDILSTDGSQESLTSSPEQMTVSRRPDKQEEYRPPLSNIFEKEKTT